MLQGILWAGVCRNNMVLAEAGEDNRDGAVVEVAQKLLHKKPTHGWEYEHARRAGLRGMKFHVYDEETKYSDDVFNTTQQQQEQQQQTDVLIWSFVVVADKSLEMAQVKSFIEKLVYITMPMRDDELWRTGDLLCAQNTFAPILLQKMEQVDDQGRLAMVNEKVNTTKQMMKDNIELALERDQTLEAMQQGAEELSAMSKQFKKRAKQVKRFKMIQNAKHGLIVGTAVTATAAVVIVPPLVALL